MAKKTEEIDLAKGREFWSFRPVTNPGAPKVDAALGQGESLGPIDRFVLNRLAGEGIGQVGGQAGTLLRRLYFGYRWAAADPEQLDEFLADTSSPEAYAQLVDRLLRFAAIWRDLGTALAGCGPLRREQWWRTQPDVSERLALPGLRHRCLQSR